MHSALCFGHGLLFGRDDLVICNTHTHKDINYQINLDKVFLTQAIDNITKDPTRYLVLYVKKFISFLLIDTSSSQPNYFNPLHYLPVLLLGITSLIGIILSDKKLPKLNYLILVFFIYVFLFSAS